MVKVQLSPYEMMIAAHVGIMRQVQNIKKGRHDYYGAPKTSGWQIHIEGAMGEYSVAKYLDIYWNGSIGNLGAADVGKIEVRTRSKHSYDLILHNADDDDALFVLVTGINGRYNLHGYIKGINGKLQKYWSDPANGRPAYFVPQEQLNRIEEIRPLTP